MTPKLSTSVDLRYRNIDVSASVSGVGDQYFRVYGYEMAEGKAFDAAMARSIKQVAVIDQNTRKRLFGETGQALGKVIILGSVPCRVIGVDQGKTDLFRQQRHAEHLGSLHHGHAPDHRPVLPVEHHRSRQGRGTHAGRGARSCRSCSNAATSSRTSSS